MTARDEKYDRRIRESIAGLPLAERQRAAETMGYADGKPLDEADIRMNARRMYDAGMGRAEIISALSVDEPVNRRIGSLNPAEVAVIVTDVWNEPAGK
jgi:hypothetical protein